MCMLPSNSSHGDAEITTELFLNVKRPSRNQCATLKPERKLPPPVTFRFGPMWPSRENVGEDWANAFIGNEPPTAAVPAAISIPLIKSRRLIPSSRFVSPIFDLLNLSFAVGRPPNAGKLHLYNGTRKTICL